jgi:hypothetical protein
LSNNDGNPADPFHSGQTRVLGEDEGLLPDKTPAPSPAHGSAQQFDAGQNWSSHTTALPPEAFDGLDRIGEQADQPQSTLPQGTANPNRGGQTVAMPSDEIAQANFSMSPTAPQEFIEPQQSPPEPQVLEAPASPPAPQEEEAESSGHIPYLETQVIVSPLEEQQEAAAPAPIADSPSEELKTVMLDTSTALEVPDQGELQSPEMHENSDENYDTQGMALGGEKTVMIGDISQIDLPQAPPLEQRGKFLIFVLDTDPILFELMPGITTVGRGMENHLVLGDPFSSRKHFAVTCLDSVYSFEDIGSDNGTLVNGHIMTHKTLETGDLLEVGNVLMRFVAGAVQDSHKQRPSPSAPIGQNYLAGPNMMSQAPSQYKSQTTQMVLIGLLLLGTLALFAVLAYLLMNR